MEDDDVCVSWLVMTALLAAVVVEAAPHAVEEQGPAPSVATEDCSLSAWPPDLELAVPSWSLVRQWGHLGHSVESPLEGQEAPEEVAQVAADMAQEQVALVEAPVAPVVPAVAAA